MGFHGLYLLFVAGSYPSLHASYPVVHDLQPLFDALSCSAPNV